MHQQQMHGEEARGAVLHRSLRGHHHLRGPALPPHWSIPTRRRRRRRRRSHGALPQRGGRGTSGANVFIVVVHPSAAALQLAAVAPTTELPVLRSRR
jgi:hypothetical protein